MTKSSKAAALRRSSLLLGLALLAFGCSNPAQGDDEDDEFLATLPEGTVRIYDAAGLAAISADLSGTYVLMNDISLSGVTWTPIGTVEAPFMGTLYGHSHAVRSLTLSLPESEYVGLFGYVGGTVDGLAVASSTITGAMRVGAIAGALAPGGTIRNCRNSSAVSGNCKVGGLVGYSYGTVSGCGNSGSISDTNGDFTGIVGGIAGYVEESAVSGCANSGTISGRGDIGGIAGHVFMGAVSGCDNSGAVSGTFYAAGGIAGYLDVEDGTDPESVAGCTVAECRNTGAVTGVNNAGGVCGTNNGTVSDCCNARAVTGDSYVGGIVGRNYGAASRCYNTGAVTGVDNAGGISGDGDSGVSGCYYLASCVTGGNTSGTAEDSDALKTQGTYEGWDFSAVWALDPAVNDGYPYLRILTP